MHYPVVVSVVPELGPLEHEEDVVLEDTVRRGLATHRASRHFRNYWRYYPDGFEDFRADLQRTWPGSDIEPPRLENPLDTKLTMFSCEGAYLRELYWAGFGFQVWCQLRTHLNRARGSTLLLVDEPETYLHPVLQREILYLLRETASDVLITTHSSEIVAEAEPNENSHHRSCATIRPPRRGPDRRPECPHAHWLRTQRRTHPARTNGKRPSSRRRRLRRSACNRSHPRSARAGDRSIDCPDAAGRIPDR